MGIQEFVLPADSDLTPCPEGCGRMTDDVAGGPCTDCWQRIADDSAAEEEEEPCCEKCGKPIYDWSDYGCERCDARVRAGEHL